MYDRCLNLCQRRYLSSLYLKRKKKKGGEGLGGVAVFNNIIATALAKKNKMLIIIKKKISVSRLFIRVKKLLVLKTCRQR